MKISSNTRQAKYSVAGGKGGGRWERGTAEIQALFPLCSLYCETMFNKEELHNLSTPAG